MNLTLGPALHPPCAADLVIYPPMFLVTERADDHSTYALEQHGALSSNIMFSTVSQTKHLRNTGTGKATDFEFGRCILRVYLKKSSVKFWRKCSMGISRDFANLSVFSYYLRYR